MACGDTTKYLVPDDALYAFLKHCSETVGDAYFRTPRNTIKAFLDLLAVIEQNPAIKWNDLITEVTIQEERSTDMDEIHDNSSIEAQDLADFKI